MVYTSGMILSIEATAVTFSTCTEAALGLLLIFLPVVILERICTWLGVWDNVDDHQSS